MIRLKITVGAFTPYNPETFEDELTSFLHEKGVISELEGKGLTVSTIAAMGRPGEIERSVMDVLLAKNPISKQKIAARLPDFTFKQVESALRRGYRKGNISSTYKYVGRNKIWYYSPTDQGKAWHDEMDDAEKNAVLNARTIWMTAVKELGCSHGSRLDLGLIGERSGLNKVQIRFGLMKLVEVNKVSKVWNPEEEMNVYSLI